MGKTFKDGTSLSSVAKKLGKQGGNATLKKYGKKHFSKIGKAGQAQKNINNSHK